MLAMPGREKAWVRRLFERAVGGSMPWCSVHSGGMFVAALRCGGKFRQTVLMTSCLPCGPTWCFRPWLGATYRHRHQVHLHRHGWVLSRAKPAQPSFTSLPDVRLSEVWVGCGDALADSANGLLFTTVGTMVDGQSSSRGHPLRFATVDLAVKPADIRAQLLKCFEVSC